MTTSCMSLIRSAAARFQAAGDLAGLHRLPGQRGVMQAQVPKQHVTVYEVDAPLVLSFKEKVLAGGGARARSGRHMVGSRRPA